MIKITIKEVLEKIKQKNMKEKKIYRVSSCHGDLQTFLDFIIDYFEINNIKDNKRFCEHCKKEVEPSKLKETNYMCPYCEKRIMKLLTMEYFESEEHTD